MNNTQHMKLPQWERSDPWKINDFNEALEKVDTELQERGINVKWFGAKGDGASDDYEAIALAIEFLRFIGGGTLYFPPGKYRIGRGDGRTRDYGGITLINISNVRIQFDLAAILWMDNLNPDSLLGDQCNGVLVRGDCDNITLDNVTVMWSTIPAERSAGDAFYFWGGVDSDVCPRNIMLNDCRIFNTPQAGAIFQGCRDIIVKNLYIKDTHADGLHFNACHRNILVDKVRGYNVGDDCVAFVTYCDLKDPSNPFVYHNGRPPFNSPDLTTRNNNHSFARDIIVDGDDHANGVRISGGYDIEIDGVKCLNKKTAVIIDSAYADGTIIKWSYFASRKIRVKNITSFNNNVGFHVQYFNNGRPNRTSWRSEEDFSLFDVDVENVDCQDENLFSIYLEKVKGVRLRGYNRVKNVEARFRNIEKVDILHLRSEGAYVNIIGNSDGWGYPLQNIPNHSVKIGTIEIENNYVEIKNMSGWRFDKLISLNSPRNGVFLQDCYDFIFGETFIHYPNRLNKSDFFKNAIHIGRCMDAIFYETYIKTDTNPVAIDVGGGSENAPISTDGVTFKAATIVSNRNDVVSGFVIQGGTYAAKNVNVNLTWLNRGEADPKWRVHGKHEIFRMSGTSSERPNPTQTESTIGLSYYDTSLGKDIHFHTPNVWHDSDGNVVT